MAMAGNSILRVRTRTQIPPGRNGGGGQGDLAPGGPGGQVASFSGADGWMPALLTPAPLRSQAGRRRRIPGPFHILFLLLQQQLPGSEGVGTHVMAGWCSRREEPGRPRRDLGIGRDAQPAPPSGPNSPCDLNKRLGISVPVSPVTLLYSSVTCGSP